MLITIDEIRRGLGRAMPSPKQLTQTLVVLVLLTLVGTGLSAQHCQSFHGECATVDLTGMEVDWVPGGGSECVISLQTCIAEGHVLQLTAVWNPETIGCVPRFLGTLVARFPGQSGFPIAHLRWDGGAILIDLTDF